ncbi:MAG: hypothetical protein QM537_02170 [Candidatus Symbiobacter sp.]|nr:hypothetical protein [Candidatus Symbiobacter sp.]
MARSLQTAALSYHAPQIMAIVKSLIKIKYHIMNFKLRLIPRPIKSIKKRERKKGSVITRRFLPRSGINLSGNPPGVLFPKTPGGLPDSDCKRKSACSPAGNDALPFIPAALTKERQKKERQKKGTSLPTALSVNNGQRELGNPPGVLFPKTPGGLPDTHCKRKSACSPAGNDAPFLTLPF